MPTEPRLETTTATTVATSEPKSLDIKRHFTDGTDVFETVEWGLRDAVIQGPDGQLIFAQKDVEFPATWSQLAVNVTTEKYFRGPLGTPDREISLRQVIDRVARTIMEWGLEQGYFDPAGDGATIFYSELAFILLHQKAAFNSPVWFNLGVPNTKPQVSACFIQAVDDSMDSIMDLAKSEVMLFKGGSGTGTNLSPLRAEGEPLRGGGKSSGPLSFMKGYDSFAGAIKSGGKTRRAAKMIMLDVDHPDVLKFIRCKGEEERKARALIDAGWSAEWNDPDGAYASVQYQNANHSVRATDEFMRAVEDEGKWRTKEVLSGEPSTTHEAKAIMRAIAEETHFCGDPGMQYDTTINAWHTCPESGRINASNPCSEYMSLDNSACNLASLNLRKFERAPNGVGWFDVEAFMHTIRVMVIAQDIMVEPAAYPTEAIGQGARTFRQLGLGYANLGGLLMSRGIPYDSDDGRRTAALVTNLMQAMAYLTSAELAEHLGAFDEYDINAESMLGVVDKHLDAAKKYREPSFNLGQIDYTEQQKRQTWRDLVLAGTDQWKKCGGVGSEHGYRNAQVSLMAPTGTISFMMDCDTTGIEPELALKKSKSLAGGGALALVNGVVGDALRNLGYEAAAVDAVIAYVAEHGRVEGCPAMEDEHLAVFDCSFRAPGGTRIIEPMGHIRMMEAVQPFLSGAISKTVNVDSGISVEEIEDLYMEAWRRGLKAIAIYRDGCKKTQPLTNREKKVVEAPPPRTPLGDERPAICHKFVIGGHEGYLHVGLYEEGTVGEIFVRMAKEGSTISGMMDAFATSISIGIQYGVPLATFVEKFKHTRFEPSGYTRHADIRIAQSIIDYIFRYLELKYLKPEVDAAVDAALPIVTDPSMTFVNQSDAPMCSNCGNMTVRSGSCYKCLVCGTSNGCS